MGKGEKRSEKVGKGGKRLETMRIDGGLIGEYGSSCAVANVHVLLTHGFPAYSVFVLNCL